MKSRTPQQRNQMLLHEPINRVIPRMAVPTIISMLITNIYNMADTFFVSQIGTSASGAVGVIFSAMIFFGALRLFRKMAKADAKLFDVYQRHIRYRRYYAANSDPWKVNTTDDRARWCGSARDNF